LLENRTLYMYVFVHRCYLSYRYWFGNLDITIGAWISYTLGASEFITVLLGFVLLGLLLSVYYFLCSLFIFTLAIVFSVLLFRNLITLLVHQLFFSMFLWISFIHTNVNGLRIFAVYRYVCAGKYFPCNCYWLKNLGCLHVCLCG
jgi:hypothetical protein